jgi:hypothetical protein
MSFIRSIASKSVMFSPSFLHLDSSGEALSILFGYERALQFLC